MSCTPDFSIRRKSVRRCVGTPRPDRRHATVATWREIEGELSVGLPPGPLESRSAFAEVLIPPGRRKGITLQYVTRVEVASEPILELADRLDRLLRDLFPPQK
jgi:hypothetical protein